VVEGVARSLDPKMNIWKVAQPVVETYIKSSIGPRAAARDLWKTLLVLGRFGPRLPDLVEAALIRQSQPEPPPGPRIWPAVLAWASLGIAVGVALTLLWHFSV
jgi:ubiquinone biosynthesis protein